MLVEYIIGGILSCVPCCVMAAIAIFIGVIAAVIMIVSKRRKSYEMNLNFLTQEVGGELKKGGLLDNPSLAGEYRGRKFLIDSFTRTTQNYDQENVTTYYQRMQVWHKGKFKGEISVQRETLFSGLSKMMGVQDIKIGNEEFDKLFMVKGSEEQVRKLLDSSLQQKLVSMKMSFNLYPDKVYFETATTLNEKDKIRAVLDLLSEIADRVEKW